MNDTVLVTGAGGFVGSAVVRLLVNSLNAAPLEFWDKTPIARIVALLRPGGSRERLEELPESQHWSIEYADITDPGGLRDLIERVRPKAILHLAINKSIYTDIDEAERYRLNVAPLEIMFEQLSRMPGTRLINTSSSWVLQAGERLNESARLEPRSFYAQNKAGTDQLLPSLHKQTGVDWINLRLFNIFGKYEDKSRLLPYLVSQLAQGEIANLSFADNIRDFSDVDYMARAYLLALQADRSACGKVYHIGSGRGISLGEFALTVAEVTGNADLIRFGSKETQDQFLKCQVADPTLAQSVLKWKPGRDARPRILSTAIWWLKRYERISEQQAIPVAGTKPMKLCRTCKSERLYMFLPLGDHPLANGFLKSEQLSQVEAFFPLDIHVCLDCGLIQVRDNVPPGFFRNYVYVPSASEQMRNHFAHFADTLIEKFLPSLQSLTIDIGCNDGLFLKFLKKMGARTLGVDPATNIIQRAEQEGLEIVNEYFTPETARMIKEKHGAAAIITATNTFHHVDDLDSFTEGVNIVLDDDGIFIIEVPHALELVKQNEFDGVYHEHVSQFTVKSLADLFRRFNLEVFHVDKLEVHGGSIRVFVRKGRAGACPSPILTKWLDLEKENDLFSTSIYDAFRKRVEKNKGSLLTLLKRLKSQGKRLAGYGASARGNTLLNYYGIGTNLLDYIVDRNSLKHGLYTPGMHIPVFDVGMIAQDKPDYLLIIAWNFAEEIIEQMQGYKSLGGRFILPIPEPKIINGE